MNELQENMRKMVSFPPSTSEDNKKRNNRNFMKSVSTKFDQMGQGINKEFHMMIRTPSVDVPKKEQSMGENKNKKHIDGDELIMNEIKVTATNISNTISKIRVNSNANNFNSREKIQSLKQNMSERIKKGKETTRFALNTMKVPTISRNVVLKHQKPKNIDSSSTSSIISSDSKTRSSNKDDDNSSSSEEEIILLDTSIDFLTDASYGKDMLEKMGNKQANDVSDVDDQSFTISDEEDELI